MVQGVREMTGDDDRWFPVRGCLIALVCAVAGCLALLAHMFGPKLWNMKSEYVTAGVIEDVQAFVEKTHGQWPRSWADLGSKDLSSYTRVDFSLDPVTATEQDVLSSIAPRSGKYYTYPHADDHLKRLYQELKDAREETVPPATGTNSAPDP
jgi:hypothetical protein